MTTHIKKVGLITIRNIRFLHFRYVQRIVNYSVLTQAVSRINLVKMSHSAVNIFIIIIIFYLENFNANVAIIMKMWGIAMSNQGGLGLASFVISFIKIWFRKIISFVYLWTVPAYWPISGTSQTRTLIDSWLVSCPLGYPTNPPWIKESFWMSSPRPAPPAAYHISKAPLLWCMDSRCSWNHSKEKQKLLSWFPYI